MAGHDDLKEFQYYAFISYSHKDMKLARWLQNKLETYKLPSKLQERESDRKKKSENPIQPVFRDETSINPGKSVEDALKSELEKSKYLIVICSPSSSASSWVDREVERFIELGREDCIMPFIVEGIPHSENPETECYVPSLRALADKKGSSILGADVQARGRREAFLCTVAFLLGIDLETLRSREDERRRRKMNFTIAISTLALALCIFGGVKAWNYYVPKATYYQDYTSRFGLPEGLGELTKKQIKSREEHFEITTQYGKIQSIAHKNQYGIITDIPDSERWDYPAYMTFSYDDSGNLISNTRYRANGTPIVTWKYTDRLRVVQFEYPETDKGASLNDDDYYGSVALTLAADTQNMEQDAYESSTSRSFIAGYMIKYTEDGLIKDLYYSDMPAFGRKTKDSNGIWGLRYDYDADGRITHIQYLDENNQLMTARGGIAQKIYVYDEKGQSVRVEYQNADGNLSNNSQGWAIDIQEYTDGNVTAEETRGVDGNLVLNHAGWARLDVVYDERGNAIEMRSTGVNGEPIEDSSGWHKELYLFDEFGRETERRGYGLDGNPKLCSEGYASCQSRYDEAGNFIEMICYDEKDEITVCYDGFASWKAVYSDKGELLERRYYDEKGKPTLIDHEYAAIMWNYDDHGNIVEFSYYGLNDEPVLSADGFAIKRVQYDARGNCIEETLYGPDENLANCYYGFAKITYQYDEQGNVIETSYYDEKGELVLVGAGYAIERRQYDDKENMTEISFYGTAGQLKMISGGYAGWNSKYDDYGNKVETAYFDTNKNLVICNEGYAVCQVQYDSLNNPIDIIYLDSNRNIVDIETSVNLTDEENDAIRGNEIVTYQIAYTDASILLPEMWIYADRNIDKDSDFCIYWEMTPKEFVGEYLPYDCYVFAKDLISGAELSLEIADTDLDDYSKASRFELMEFGIEMVSWVEEMGETIISNKIVELGRPYCKIMSCDEEFTYYYYETVNGGERFTFIFMMDTREWDPTYEHEFDEIVRRSELNDTTGP